MCIFACSLVLAGTIRLMLRGVDLLMISNKLLIGIYPYALLAGTGTSYQAPFLLTDDKSGHVFHAQTIAVILDPATCCLKLSMTAQALSLEYFAGNFASSTGS